MPLVTFRDSAAYRSTFISLLFNCWMLFLLMLLIRLSRICSPSDAMSSDLRSGMVLLLHLVFLIPLFCFQICQGFSPNSLHILLLFFHSSANLFNSFLGFQLSAPPAHKSGGIERIWTGGWKCCTDFFNS